MKISITIRISPSRLPAPSGPPPSIGIGFMTIGSTFTVG